MEIIEYTLPANWASALINDDYTGLEDEEEKQLLDFLEKTVEERGYGHWSLNDNEPLFYKFHDARPYGVLAADCLKFEWVKMK
ncbi:hypothetical protein [Nitrosophilus labii]|uniref:hypothetical protein n=1 Tax=Nitrosophilus labii TaxID=2706014 RepID=UPI00165749AE|nr:hypothetical protein [Nitrosophilus labii]